MKLEVLDLSYAYRDSEILRNISFALEKGDCLSVLGSNGAGKTTLFKCILGILTDYSGEILADGRRLKEMSVQETAALTAYVPQTNRAAFGYCALDMVLMGTAGRQTLFGQPGKKEIVAACGALEQMGIAALAQRSFVSLSGGEQQLVLVARALVQRAEILIMDEPTAGLDFGNQLRVLEKIRALTKTGCTVLFSTHNPQHALSFSNRMLAIRNGRMAAFGDTRTMLTPELIRQLYGVSAQIIERGDMRAILPHTRQD